MVLWCISPKSIYFVTFSITSRLLGQKDSFSSYPKDEQRIGRGDGNEKTMEIYKRYF